MLARNQLRQIAPLLRVGAVAADLVDAEIRVRAVGEPDRGGASAYLLHRDDMLQIAHSGTAIFLLDGDSEEAEIAHLAPEIGGEIVGFVDLPGARRDLRRGKVRDALAQQLGGLAEVEIEAGIGVPEHRSLPRR